MAFFVVLRIRMTELVRDAHVAQLVEHVLGKDEVISSILIMGSHDNLSDALNKRFKRQQTQENKWQRSFSKNETARERRKPSATLTMASPP